MSVVNREVHCARVLKFPSRNRREHVVVRVSTTQDGWIRQWRRSGAALGAAEIERKGVKTRRKGEEATKRHEASTETNVLVAANETASRAGGGRVGVGRERERG
ncbi:serine/threonine-protein phosphatase 4 regulatory subunit 1-like isoform X2 [Vespula maculifrons]|uniref:Serine/threonine-protein phosphatase 4 regulatory subunit 1-like isoform X2 n=1 Tax=Vespula maculifrons TaxID=7453 RepID=A0ABD2CNL4_VESMC